MRYPNLKLALVTTNTPAYQVARKLGLRPDFLTRIVMGIQEPTAELRRKLAIFLGVREDILFSEVPIKLDGRGEGDRS